MTSWLIFLNPSRAALLPIAHHTHKGIKHRIIRKELDRGRRSPHRHRSTIPRATRQRTRRGITSCFIGPGAWNFRFNQSGCSHSRGSRSLCWQNIQGHIPWNTLGTRNCLALKTQGTFPHGARVVHTIGIRNYVKVTKSGLAQENASLPADTLGTRNGQVLSKNRAAKLS